MNFSLDDKHYILWIKSHCPWCQKAVDILSNKLLSYKVFDMEERLEELELLKNKLDWQTVPIVFEVNVKGDFKLVGGYTDLEKYLGETNDSM